MVYWKRLLHCLTRFLNPGDTILVEEYLGVTSEQLALGEGGIH